MNIAVNRIAAVIAAIRTRLAATARDGNPGPHPMTAALLGPVCRAHDVLFSSAILKKTGLRLRQTI